MHLKQFIGDSHTHSIPLTWPLGGAPFTPGTDWLLIFTLKASASDPDTAALIQKASGAGITATGSTAAVSTVPQDTTEMAPADRLPWDIQAQHTTTGEVRTVAAGRMSLSRDVTRQTTTSIPVHTTEPPVPFRDPDAVRHSQQSLTDPQKIQARTNIGAASVAQGQKADSAIQPGNPALSDARTPLGHAQSHTPGGSDALIRIDDTIPARSLQMFSVEGAGGFVPDGRYNERPVFRDFSSSARFIFGLGGYDNRWVFVSHDLMTVYEYSYETTVNSPVLAQWDTSGSFGELIFGNITYGNNVAANFVGEIYVCGSELWICVATDGTGSGTQWRPISSDEVEAIRTGLIPTAIFSETMDSTENVVVMSGNKTRARPAHQFTEWLRTVLGSLNFLVTAGGSWNFPSSTRPTSSGTGTPAESSLITATDSQLEELWSVGAVHRMVTTNLLVPATGNATAANVRGFLQLYSGSSAGSGVGHTIWNQSQVYATGGISGPTVSTAFAFSFSGVAQFGGSATNKYRLWFAAVGTINLADAAEPIANTGIGMEIWLDGTTRKVRMFYRKDNSTATTYSATYSLGTNTVQPLFEEGFLFDSDGTNLNLYWTKFTTGRRISTTPIITWTNAITSPPATRGFGLFGAAVHPSANPVSGGSLFINELAVKLKQ